MEKIVSDNDGKRENEPDLKCVLCGMEAEYVQSGMSLCKEHFKSQQVENRNVDLIKIQIYADKCHTVFASRLSFLFVVFSLVGVFYGLFYQGLFTSNFQMMFVGLVAIVTIIIAVIIYVDRERRKYSENWKAISNMIEKVKKGESLSVLDELDEKRKNC